MELWGKVHPDILKLKDPCGHSVPLSIFRTRELRLQSVQHRTGRARMSTDVYGPLKPELIFGLWIEFGQVKRQGGSLADKLEPSLGIPLPSFFPSAGSLLALWGKSLVRR